MLVRSIVTGDWGGFRITMNWWGFVLLRCFRDTQFSAESLACMNFALFVLVGEVVVTGIWCGVIEFKPAFDVSRVLVLVLVLP